jgi:hypothetical protein
MRVGDRWMFALEFEIRGEPRARAWNEWWGSLLLWADGHLVGKPYEVEMIQTGLDSLRETANGNRAPASLILSAFSPKEALDAVMWAHYDGKKEHRPLKLSLESEVALLPLEILPSLTGPFFDGWEAIILEDRATERFVFRQEGAEAAEAIWPLGTFRRVVGEAQSDFERIARSILKESASVT